MRIKRPSWLLLGVLLFLSGCSPTRLPAPDAERPPGPIPTPPDAPAEPTFKLDVPPHVPPLFMGDGWPLQPLQVENTLMLAARGSATRAGATGAARETGLVEAIALLYGGTVRRALWGKRLAQGSAWRCLGLLVSACAILQAQEFQQAVDHLSQAEVVARWGLPQGVVAGAEGQTLCIDTVRAHVRARPGGLVVTHPG